MYTIFILHKETYHMTDKKSPEYLKENHIIQDDEEYKGAYPT